MSKLLWVIMLLLSVASPGLDRDIASASPEEESAPPARAEESRQPLNLGDLLPSSQDSPTQDSPTQDSPTQDSQDNRPPTERRWYAITDRPPQAPAQTLCVA
jgi:hypothetical protein